MRRLGFLQLDPIATVATPQELVLWSRLGAFDRGELDRLLWEERALFEWNAFIWPIESLPMVRGLMRRRRTSTHYAHERWMHEFMAENQSFRRYVMRELERRGPLLSRELDDRAAGEPRDHRWYGARRVGHMLTILHLRGEIAVAGTARAAAALGSRRARSTRPGAALTQAQARRALDEQRFRALGVRLEKGRLLAHPDATDGPIPDRVDAALAVRPPDPRPRPHRGAVGLLLPARDVRHARPSASTATTSCRCSWATASSGGPSRSSTARPAP